ncbi:unnamed protein product [Acanthoscelides obtectus]|nr:unnamed protein product [Acanthoscelides obtectus]CAK1650906.1 hypothetical protein AOBTE_LOCUS16964 [Acanthoscelides obtectus]
MAETKNIDDDVLIPDTIAALPPVNANEYNTDEDSGDENEVDINNLPGSQLMIEVEVVFENKGSNQTTVESDFDSDDDLPLSTFLRKKRPKLSKPNYSWKKGDINQDFPEWVNGMGMVLNEKKLLSISFVTIFLRHYLCWLSGPPGGSNAQELCEKTDYQIAFLKNPVCSRKNPVVVLIIFWRRTKIILYVNGMTIVLLQSPQM